jgi:Ca-activated chloride channel family protein
MIRFLNWYFLLLIPAVIYLFLIRRKKSALKFSSVKILENGGMKKTIKHRIGKFVTTAAVILLIIALARPQILEGNLPVHEKGIDIAIVLDVSGSMQSVDFEPSRLAVALETIDKFIRQRPQDRISLVIFAGEAYTKIPLTLDHNIIRESLKEVSTDSVNEDGTAIGMAISVGINRLKKSDAASRIMLLVTDGDNNAGAISPEAASELAKELGIKIYTIGVGTDETIIPVRVFGQIRYQRMEGGLNEELLRAIADTTEGQYYRAKDSKTLDAIFNNINRLEKTEFEQDHFRQYSDLAFIFIKIGLVLLLAGIFLDRYYFVQIP